MYVDETLMSTAAITIIVATLFVVKFVWPVSIALIALRKKSNVVTVAEPTTVWIVISRVGNIRKAERIFLKQSSADHYAWILNKIHAFDSSATRVYSVRCDRVANISDIRNATGLNYRSFKFPIDPSGFTAYSSFEDYDGSHY